MFDRCGELPRAVSVSFGRLGEAVSGRSVASWLRGRDVAVAYAAVVVVVAVALVVLPAAVADRVVSSSSTNLVNLRQHPPFVLVVSAFVEPSLWQLWIVVPLVVAWGEAQRWLGRSAVLITALLGHVGATLLVSTLLAAGIARGRIALDEASATDVGVSYGLVAVLGLLAARLNRDRSHWYVRALSLFFGAALVIDRSFTDLGHLAAWGVGLALAVLVTRAQDAGPTPPALSDGPRPPP